MLGALVRATSLVVLAFAGRASTSFVNPACSSSGFGMITPQEFPTCRKVVRML